jgi:sterol desaturase/sphingolipid hydroxylase (fatty acid hydroxylase superfamily)
MNPSHQLGTFIDLQQLQMVLLVGGLAVFWLLESAMPQVRTAFRARLRSGARNLGIFILCTLVTSVVIGALYYWSAAFLAVNRIGLLYMVSLPFWLALVLGFIALDFGDYLFHRISHEKKWLWVMHAVHHSEPQLDITTHLRQHPAHLVIAVGWRLAVIAAFGVPFWLVLMRDAAIVLFVEWQHSNVRVPQRLDRWLQTVIVTPGMHRIHHSPIPEETDSNYGGFLSLWDRLLGTYRAEKLPSRMPFGLRQLAPARFQSLTGMLMTPLRAWSLSGRL